MLYLCAAIFGYAHGGMATAESPIIARLFGLGSHGLIFGVAGLGFTCGATIGPFLTGHIFDLTGSYQVAFLVCAALGAIGFISSAILRPTPKMGIILLHSVKIILFIFLINLAQSQYGDIN